VSDLTTGEQKNVRAALVFLRARTGGWKPLAKALHTHPLTLSQRKLPISASLAVRVARLASVGVDDVLGGKYRPPGRAPTADTKRRLSPRARRLPGVRELPENSVSHRTSRAKPHAKAIAHGPKSLR
jgi:hypothetical protein